MAVAFTSSTSETPQARGFELIAAELAALRDVAIGDSTELAGVMVQVEAVKRQAHALSIDLLAASEAAGLHYLDGHSSAKVMMRHVDKLSGGEAAGRDKCRRMFAVLDVIADAYRKGSLGTDQVMLLGRLFSNVRVRGAMVDRQDWFLDLAGRVSFKRFEERVLEWQRLIDEDGPEPPGDRTVENRTSNMVQNPFDLSWDLTANFASVDGAFVNEVHRAYCDALFDADWAEAKARVGDGVCAADLGRTDAQRKADAWVQICADAQANPAAMAPVSFSHSIVWSASAFEEMTRRMSGATPKPLDVDDDRCETPDGVRVDPAEAFANAIVNRIRRVVIDAKGVVLDLGHGRFFTGLAREAVRISGRECFWPGCWVPASRCEIDHLHDHAKGGSTNPNNAGPGCGRHNRWKQKGYTVWRDPTGHIRVHRADGTEVT